MWTNVIVKGWLSSCFLHLLSHISAVQNQYPFNTLIYGFDVQTINCTFVLPMRFFLDKMQTLLAAFRYNDGERVTYYRLQGHPCRTAINMTSVGTTDLHLSTR